MTPILDDTRGPERRTRNEAIAEGRAGSLKVGKVDVDDEPKLAFRAGVQGIPYVVLYRDGLPAARWEPFPLQLDHTSDKPTNGAERWHANSSHRSRCSATECSRGIAGTAAMDLLWYRRYKRDGGELGLLDWEFSAGTESYEQAGAPAQVGKQLVEGFLRTEPDPHTARTMNNAVHWVNGSGWGALHGLLVASGRKEARAGYGLATGATAWAASYALLARAKLYKPMREYPASVLGKDLSAHLVYGLATGAGFRLLTRDKRG